MGRRKIQEYTRYCTVLLCVIQGTVWMKYLEANAFIYPEYRGTIMYWLMGLLTLTAGTIFLMWLGEQIDKYGIGNGVSLIIMAGIVSRLPTACLWVWDPETLVISLPGARIAPEAEGRISAAVGAPISLITTFQQPDIEGDEVRVQRPRGAIVYTIAEVRYRPFESD